MNSTSTPTSIPGGSHPDLPQPVFQIPDCTVTGISPPAPRNIGWRDKRKPMTDIMDRTTIVEAFAAAVAAHADRPFLIVPANPERAYLPAGYKLSYSEAGRRVEELAALYRQRGYGVGQRVATLLENRPEHILHTLALHSLGVCCVPINPDYRAAEIAYLLDHSEPDLILTLGERQA